MTDLTSTITTHTDLTSTVPTIIANGNIFYGTYRHFDVVRGYAPKGPGPLSTDQETFTAYLIAHLKVNGEARNQSRVIKMYECKPSNSNGPYDTIAVDGLLAAMIIEIAKLQSAKVARLEVWTRMGESDKEHNGTHNISGVRSM
jgi:hypothetical protein